MGAIYLDLGYGEVRRVILEIITPYIEADYHFLGDYKSILQEMVQTDKKSLEYRLVSETGPSHDKTFVVEVVIDDIVYGVGRGKSKKQAEQEAAMDAYQKRAN